MLNLALNVRHPSTPHTQVKRMNGNQVTEAAELVGTCPAVVVLDESKGEAMQDLKRTWNLTSAAFRRQYYALIYVGKHLQYLKSVFV